MKIVHLSTTDYGGAFKAAYRICESMKSFGLDSRVLVRSKTGDIKEVLSIVSLQFPKLISKIKNLFNLMLSKKNIQSDFWGSKVSKNPLILEADIIILHWVNSFISYKEVKKLIELDKKVIWVMHDMWLFTGGCHYDQYCGRFQKGCGLCPMFQSDRKKDITYYNFLQKKAMLNDSNIVVVGPSSWIVNEGSKSDILKEKKVVRIPNPINSLIYRVIEDKNTIRIKYKVDINKKIILFGAMNSLGNPIKGYTFLKEALKYLDKDKYLLIVYGNQQEDTELGQIIKTIFWGMIKEENTLVDVYNIADVFVVPSSQENYPNSILEAAACGTPTTAFETGGIPDIIKHKQNGYLAKCWDIKDLAEGISYCADNCNFLGNNARINIEEENSYYKIGSYYKELCEKL